MAGSKQQFDSIFNFMSRNFSSVVSQRGSTKILNPNYIPEAHRLSATYVKQQERLEKIARIQKESLEAKLLSDAISLKQKQTTTTTTINKKTGIPLYNMQPQKSSAHLFKEARSHKIPYESVVAAEGLQKTPVDSQKSFLSRLWVPVLTVLTVGAGIEAAVVYSKGADGDATDTTSSITYSPSKQNIASHKDVYTRSTARLIQDAVTEMESRKARSNAHC